MQVVQMSGLDTPQIVTAGACFVPALLWAIVAQEFWTFRSANRSTSQLYRLLPMLTTCLAIVYAFFFVQSLLPPELCRERPPALVALWIGSDLLVLLAVAMFRHAAVLFPVNEQRPSGHWLIVNYGLAAALALLDLFPSVLPGATWEAKITVLRTVFFSYVIGVLVVSLRQISRFARGGVWRPGGLGEARYADLFVLAIGLLGVTALFFLDLRELTTPVRLRQTQIVESILGIVLAAPFAARALGAVIRKFLLVCGTILVGASTYGLIRLISTGIDPRLQGAVDLATLFVPLLTAVAVRSPLQAAIERVLFRRSRHLLAELHTFLARLSPELGIVECCQRALAEVARLMSLRGAAILLTNRPGIVTHGVLNTAPLEQARAALAGDPGLPPGPFSAKAFRELCGPLKDALIEADVVGVIPIASPRRRWGHALITTGGLAASFSDDDIQAMQTFGDQLALILDAAELLERTVSVERSLAHSEKLAAIGELAARVAHEIRNPVTAARSLAQQLVREPDSPFAAEHELILEELERIERQVAALLRFARREEFEFETLDLGGLVGSTASDLRARVEKEGIALRVSVPDGIRARIDRDKFRQVLINLIENAVDALGQCNGNARVSVALSASNGSAELRVTDNGPGVSDPVRERLFEPFFSLKENGTGLGLAIARRTIEAHGGRIEAQPADGGGLTFEIDLPLAGPPRYSSMGRKDAS
jgi:signal transduction histidine kinase